jgi:hypothetical protein
MPSLSAQACCRGSPHVPSAAQAALKQEPPQHSAAVAHTSPFCVQSGVLVQTPPTQSWEQHSASEVQALFSVLHAGFSGTHAPPEQLPLQHDALEVHA